MRIVQMLGLQHKLFQSTDSLLLSCTASNAGIGGLALGR